MSEGFSRRDQLAEEVMEALARDGRYVGRGREIYVRPEVSEVGVREPAGGPLVAYSSTRADFEDSIAEFVYDFMV